MKDSKNLFKGVGFIGIAMCGVCCSLPALPLIFGLSAVNAAAGFFGWVSLSIMVTSGALLGIYYYKKRKSPSCEAECGCKEKQKIEIGTLRQ
jgi:hypothetical protein